MSSPEPVPRFVALDVHKHYVVVAAVDAQQQVVLSPCRVPLETFDRWLHQHLRATDAVALEATTNAWDLYDQLQPHVATVTVVHPQLVKLITQARVKTDARDALHLARLLAAGLLPAVWVPPPEVRELRALVAHRQRLIRQRAQARNRLQSALHRHNLPPPPGSPFATSHRAWWAALPLSPSEQLRVGQDLALLDFLQPQLNALDAELARLSTTERWATQVALLVQLPGIGMVNAMVLLSAIGEVTRFPSAKQLVGYSGLGASVHASGQTQRNGRITKQGRREIRSTMVEAAWMAVRSHPHWRGQFERLLGRMEKGKAIVAIARKLLVVVWHVLTAQVADRRAEAEQVARKLMTWGQRHSTARKQGLRTAAFVRLQLDRLRIGADLQEVVYYTRRYRLPPSESAATVS